MNKSVVIIDPVGAKAGMDFYDLLLLRALSDRGFKTFLLSNISVDDSRVTVKNIFKNANITGLPSAVRIFIGTIRSFFFLKKQKTKWIILHIFRGDFIELSLSFIAKLIGFKVLLIIHDIESLDTKKSSVTGKFVLEKFHDIKVVHNHFSMDELKKIISPAAGMNIHTIRHGNFIDLVHKESNHKKAYKHFNIDPTEKYLLFFGQIKKVKGLDLLINAFSKSKIDFHLIIAGKLRNDNWERYQRIIDEQQLQSRVVTFIRHITDEEREMLFRIAHTLILPYRLIYQSGVLLMAMSFGKAVVASDLPPFKEIIQHGQNGFLFENNNLSDLIRVMDEICSGKFNLEKIGQNAKQFVLENYSWDKIADEYAQLLNK